MEKTNLEKRIESIKAICESWIDNDTDTMDTGEVVDDFHQIYTICRNIELEDIPMIPPYPVNITEE